MPTIGACSDKSASVEVGGLTSVCDRIVMTSPLATCRNSPLATQSARAVQSVLGKSTPMTVDRSTRTFGPSTEMTVVEIWKGYPIGAVPVGDTPQRAL